MSIDIESHEFKDEDVHAQIQGDEVWLVATAYSAVNKADVIALAKHFNLNAHDIDCSEHKALQEYYAQIEEDSFDSDAKLHTEIAELNRKLTMKRVS